jgi:hypothetical protein
MTFKLADFRIGDIVRTRFGDTGTVVKITGQQWLHVQIDNCTLGYRPDFITEIVSAMDGKRRIGH